MRTNSFPFRMNAIASAGAFALMAACSLAGAGTLSGVTTTVNGVNVITNPPKITAPDQKVTVQYHFGVAYYGPDKNPNVTCWAKLTYDGETPGLLIPFHFPLDGYTGWNTYTKPGKHTANLMGVAYNGKPACLGDVTANITIENGMPPPAVAVLITQPIAVAPITIVQGNLSAVPSGNSNGREIFFKLPLNGDTKNCVVNYTYGEKPGVGPNSDGDSHMNGQSNGDRSRTYSADGTYTFTAKAKSGCTGEAHVTFTIGNPARVGTNTPLVLTPATPAAGVNATPGLTMAPDKITSVEVALVGQVLTVKQHGTGNANAPACGSEVYLTRVAVPGSPQLPDGFKQTSQSLNQWPKTQTYAMTLPGVYEVHLRLAHQAPTCGYNGPGSIPGDLTKIEVSQTPK